ncbi:hypothetical protein BDW22DRAFT_18460 [Trametopsis cervina]|nr:hypothetical protein BDW22DRAFT_18460 [Trametopsis cervina]
MSPAMLKSILAHGSHLLSRLGNHSHSSHTTISHAPYQLPEPREIVTDLTRIGWPLVTAARISQLYIESAVGMKQEYEHHIETATRAYINVSSDEDTEQKLAQMRSVYLACYIRLLQDWGRTITSRSERHLPAVQSPAMEHRHTSNKASSHQESTRVLEIAFRSNPYPSRNDKLALAKEARMDYKQVHTWFQNRRNRSKRDGEDLRRLTFVKDEGLSPTATSMSHDMLAMDENSEYIASIEVQTPTPRDDSHPFELHIAPHAFPSPFPPCCDYASIHAPSQVRFETIWPRYPSTGNHTLPSSSDSVDSLASSLASLVLEDVMEKPRSPLNCLNTRSKYRTSQTSSACFPSAVYPPSAPLSALVQGVKDVRGRRSSILQKAASVKGPSSSKSNSIASARHQQSTRARSSLPLRVPKSMPKLVRECTHPYSDRSESRSKVKRLSSCSSLSSISSDSSFSSIDSLFTPPSSPRALTPQTKQSVDFIFEPIIRDFNDSQIPRVSLEEGLQMNWDTY